MLLTIVISLVLGGLTTWVGGTIDATGTPHPWTFKEFAANSALVFSAATAFYKTWFQGLNFNKNTLEKSGPFAASGPPAPGLVEHVRPRVFDMAGNEVDPQDDLNQGDHRARIYPKR
jgi:hypothetical protein